MSDKLHGYYLATIDVMDQNHVQSGVDRKIISQVECLTEAGLDCKFIFCRPPETLLRRGLGSLPGFSDGINWPQPKSVSDSAYLYIRRPLFSSYQFLLFLKKVKCLNPAIKIILEIPSYPYDKEMDAPELFFARKKEFKYRRLWHRYIDRIADLSGSDSLFGIKTLHIINGINMKGLRVRKPSTDETETTINMIFPAFFGPWHGCDLLVEGISEYYRCGGTRNIQLHIAGGGKLVPTIAQQVHDLGLKDHVTFHGELTAVELDDLYDKCSLAVGSLGLHRRDQNCLDSSLKTREYLAKGIPFFYAGKVDVLESTPVGFCLQLDSKEQPIDMFQVVNFYERLYSRYNEQELIKSIRAYAEDNVSMEVAMSQVVDYILDIPVERNASMRNR